MKLRDIVLSATIGLGAIGCSDKKVESLYDLSTFPKADSVSVDSSLFNHPLFVSYISEYGFNKGRIIYINNKTLDDTKKHKVLSSSEIRWFYDNEGREVRREHDNLKTKGLDRIDHITYVLEHEPNLYWVERIMQIDYGANGTIDKQISYTAKGTVPYHLIGTAFEGKGE